MYDRTFSGALGPYFAQIKEIAAGGNGRVLSGIDTRFDFPVCIKRISVANKDECRAALREIRIRRRLRHENIVGLLNAIVSDGTDISEITPANFRETSCLFLVQELLDADLRQVIESYTRLSDEYIKLFFYQLLRGLKYIHSANVLHRDLKPSNVMINVNSLQLMIGDFGHSMVLDPEYSHSNSEAVSDTSLWYKAPELVLRSAQYSTASDIWAAGCILAEMLLGRPLFEGENDLEQLELIIHAIEVPLKDQSYIRTFLTEEVNTMYSGQPKFPLQSKFQKVEIQALHLLKHLLSFDPDDRVTTELALSHPFLQEYACVADEPVCLKPLHLEHEVDDFLEYTLKDLIVGECIALAEEQPRIHLQMSSYSSLTDIPKECNVSPNESASQSLEERRGSLDLKTVSEDYDEESNENEGSRFKVLEVLKEEHGSSSDSNGLAVHEEGVSEEPLVSSDHAMFSSTKWEKERHKSGHRRHHHHRRKKKFHVKSPSSETEPTLDSNGCIPESDGEPKHHIPRLYSPEEDQCLSPRVEIHPPESTETVLTSETTTQAQDDKVQELIMRSRQLIADQTKVVNGVPAITDICSDVQCSYSPNNCLLTSKEDPVVPMEISDEKPIEKSPHEFSSLDDLSKLNHYKSTVDLGVAEVIRRSQELLGDVYRSNASEEKGFVVDENDRVQELISRSEQLLKSKDASVEQYDYSKNKRSETERNFSKDSQKCLQTVNEQSEFPLKETSSSYPSPFTDKSLEPSTVPSLNPIIHSSVKNEVNTTFVNYTDTLQPIPSDPSSLQSIPKDPYSPLPSIPSDPYHLKESNRRMHELLEESHSLLTGLKTDQVLCSETGCEKNAGGSCPENEEKFELTKTENFRKDMDEIDLNEMKLVLDQAKKLLEESSEMSGDMMGEGKEMNTSACIMEIDHEKVVERNGEKMEVDETVDMNSDVNIQDVLKDIPSFQNQHDFVEVLSEPSPISQQAAVFEIVKVKLISPLEKQTMRVNSLTPSAAPFTQCKDNESMRLHEVEQDAGDSDKDFLVKKRSSEFSSDDPTHKHFKNSSVTTADNSSTIVSNPAVNNLKQKIGKEEIKKHCFENGSEIPNGFNANSLDLNVDKRLIEDFKYSLGSPVNGIDFDFKSEKPKYEPASLENRDLYSNTNEVVDKLCGNKCRIQNNTKNSARLQNFYAALKIKSIMRNRSRPHREKRHDTYPF